MNLTATATYLYCSVFFMYWRLCAEQRQSFDQAITITGLVSSSVPKQ
jgi:hypothetical protein